MKKNYIFLCVMIFLSIFTKAQENREFSIDADYFSRGEHRDGYKTFLTEEQNPAQFVVQRARLSLNFKNEKWSLRFSPQDIRVWGDTTCSTDNSALDFYEGWLKYQFNENFAIKIGRQELDYEEGRLISTLGGWKMSGETHDAVLFTYENKENKFNFHLGGSVGNKNEDVYLTNYSTQYKYLGLCWISKEINENIRLSLLDLMDASQKKNVPSVNYVRNTIGLNANLKFGSVEFVGMGYYQHGKLNNTRKISSNFLVTKLSYKVSMFKFVAGFEHLSGSDLSDSAKFINDEYRTFNKLWGGSHGAWGHLDHFTNIAIDTKEAGLNDIFLRISADFSENLKLEGIYHYFLLDKDYIAEKTKFTKVDDKALSSEFDFVLTYKPTKICTLQAGYSFMLQEKTLELIKLGTTDAKLRFPQWFYLAVQFKPTIFSTK